MKQSLKILIVFLAFFFMQSSVLADTYKARIDYNSVNLRTGPGTNYESVKTLGVNATFNLVDTNLYPNEKGCSDGWYKIYYSGSDVGYVCSSYVTVITVNEENATPANECETDLQAKGFPSSYWPGLCSLKSKYPNWNFVSDINGLDFATAISKEAIGKKSLIQTSNQGYLSTSSDSYDYLTDTFVVKEGTNWYSASESVVAFYMDPRNFFDEKYIFMFEKLSFDASYQNVDAVKAVLSGRDLESYAETIYNASSLYNINAIYLASRIRQETGANFASYSLAGNPITYSGITYDAVYNPYNIGANTGAYDGLVWAVAGTTYQRPWTTIDVAIAGGAEHISSTYISKGQDSGYFQKFNTSSYSSYSAYSHQYMANVKAAYSEASIAYSSYESMNLLTNTSFTFVIPVYSNMNEAFYSLPNAGNPNNHLKNLTINGNQINGFSHDNFSYTYYVAAGASELTIAGDTINNKAKVSGTGKVLLDQNEKIVEVIITAENGSIQKYTIKVIKTDGIEMNVNDIVANLNLPVNDNHITLSVGYTVDSITSLVQKVAATSKVSIKNKNTGLIATGDEITIVNGDGSITINAVVKGDPTGDGNINIQDLLKVQKYILGYSDLSGSYQKAADTNQDGIVDIVDLLRVQKHILGYLEIN